MGVALCVALAFGGVATSAEGRDKIRRVQLDADAKLERVIVQRGRCRDTYPCSRLVIRDGNRRVALTKISQRPRHPYHWTVTRVRFRDLTGDGVREIIWSLFTTGGTGSSPALRGIHQWDGRRARRIFRLANARRVPGYGYTLGVKARVIQPEGMALPQLEILEYLHGPNDATCCPSFVRRSRYQWNGERMALTPGSVSYEPVVAD